jgi:hypothetical protein
MELKDQVLESLYGHQPIKTMLRDIQEAVLFDICENAIINPKQWEYNAPVSEFINIESLIEDFRAIKES